jgi:hypothetical protein
MPPRRSRIASSFLETNVKRHLWVAALATVFLCTQAGAAGSYASSQTETTAVSVTSDGPAGYEDHAGVATSTLTSSSASVGSTDVATAGAFYGDGLLTTSADVSANSIGNSVSTASFSGSFTSGNWVSLGLDYTFQNLASGSGDASTSLFVSVINDGVTLFSDYVQGPWQFSYSPAAGSTSEFDLLLTSDVSAGFVAGGPGNASSFGLVTFTSSVPEAPVWLLLSLGMGMVVVSRRIVRRGAMPA